MHSSSLRGLALVFGMFAAAVDAQGVTDDISPLTQAPAGCVASFEGSFEVTVVAANMAKRDATVPMSLQSQKECGHDGVLVVTLKDSVAKDALSRTGYIASNYQFQFDKPAQAGSIYTAGFSLCENGLIALGNSTQFWQCKSGDFWNLYDRHWAAQCDPVVMKAMPCGPGAGGNVQGDMGHIVGTSIVTTTVVRPIADGQPQVITTVMPIAMCQIGDGQVQAHTTPCASLSVPLQSAPPISQITDGQIQVPSPSSGPVPPPAMATPTMPPAPPASVPTGGVAKPTEQPPKPAASASSPPDAPPLSAGGKLRWSKLAWAMSGATTLAVMSLL